MKNLGINFYHFLPTHLSTILLRRNGLILKSISKRYCQVAILFSRLFCLALVSIDYTIECETFAKVFHSARNHLLDLYAAKVLEEPQIPPQNQNIFRAASAADVFGGMGSWNDEPGWRAQDKGLGQVYDELSDQLLRNIRLAILYAINEW